MSVPIAIIADIHGNRWALEAVLRDIERRGIQQIFNLGDNLFGPLDPAGTADLLIAHNIPGVSGNGDRELLAPPAQPSASLLFTRKHVTSAHLEWLSSLPKTAIVADDLFLCHGTPSDDNTYLVETVTPAGDVFLRDTAAIVADVAGVEQSVILCGHSHQARDIFLPPGKLIVNPGSVGLPAYTDDLPYPHPMQSGSPHARYAILTKVDAGWQIEHVLVPYNWELAASIARNHQRPDWAVWIATGRA